MENPSSENELKELQREGKITETEYKELLEEMGTKPKADESKIIYVESEHRQTSGLTIASLVFSILSIILGPFGCIPGIICGHLARREIKTNPTIRGDSLAKSGLIIGYAFLVFFIIAILLFLSVRASPSHSS